MTNGTVAIPAVRSLRQTMRRVMLSAIAVLLVVVLAAFGVLVILSPGTPEPILDDQGGVLAGSISEKTRVTINGVAQGMFIRSRNSQNPVLLYVHGGLPDYFLTTRYPTGLEEYFTVVWWEQRGSGLSYNPDIPPETVTPEQLVSDMLELTRYLQRRFGREKIYLMGRSGGTFIGIQGAARAPALYHAYIAVAQMTNQLKSEKLAHAYMLQRYREAGNTRMAQRLEAARVGDTAPLPDSYLKVRDVAMHELGIGTTRDIRSIVTGLFARSLLSREYTLREKIGLWRGKLFSGQRLWNLQLATDLTTKVTRLELPVYFFSRRVRLHRLLSTGQVILRAPRCAREGFLHIQPVGAQPHIRGAGQGAQDHAVRRIDGIDVAG